MTSLSRVLGLVRDVVIASTFGASGAADAFLVAFRIPNFLRRLFAEGAFSQALVPVLSEVKERSEREALRTACANIAGVLGLILFATTLVGVALAPQLVYIFAPGFSDEPQKMQLAGEMLRITFPYLFFISLSAFFAGVLHTFGRFSAASFAPVLLNVCLISAAIWLAPRTTPPIVALAWGVLAAGLAQCTFMLIAALRLQILARPRLGFRDRHVVKVAKLMVPALLGVSVAQINLLADTIIASFLATGSIAWLYFADRLVEFPLGVFGIALATVILPKLSADYATGSDEHYSSTMDWALRLVFLIALPATLALMVLSGPMLTTIYSYGEFGNDSVWQAQKALIAYSVGLTGFILVKVLAPGFFSRQDMRTPVRIAIIAMLANIVLSLALIFPFAHAGLALATALSSALNAGLLFRTLRARSLYTPRPGWAAFIFRVAVSALGMAVALWWIAPDTVEWMSWTLWRRVGWLAGLVFLGLAVYGVLVTLLGVSVKTLLTPAHEVVDARE